MYNMVMYEDIYWCDILQLPDLPGGDLHGVRRPHEEDPRGLQRVQVHWVQHVGKDHHSITITINH